MRAEFVSKVCSSVLDVPPLRARAIVGNLAVRLLRDEKQPLSERPDEDYAGNPLPKMEIMGDVAVIPIIGVIWMNLPTELKMLRWQRFTDANDVEEDINRALADANVKLIVFNMNSPGGWDLASLKIFELIEAANKKKPCFAYCGDGCDMASGAYYAAAACTAIYAGWYADGVGCVGCYLAWLDDTEYWANLGIKFEVFRSGELKGMGIDALTEEQRAYLLAMVVESGDRFRKNVLKYRRGIVREDLEGQWFDGAKAAERGFVGGNAENLQVAINKFRRIL